MKQYAFESLPFGGIMPKGQPARRERKKPKKGAKKQNDLNSFTQNPLPEVEVVKKRKPPKDLEPL